MSPAPGVVNSIVMWSTFNRPSWLRIGS